MKTSLIQWCHSTINPVMGCPGCELYPVAGAIMAAIDRELRSHGIAGWECGTARKLLEMLLAKVWGRLLKMIGTPGPGHINALTTTNVYHLRKHLREEVAATHGKEAGELAECVVRRMVRCYAGKLHLNRGYDITKPRRKVNAGYAMTFEEMKEFAGRIEAASKWPDLVGSEFPETPWLSHLARLIFLSDMGDAFGSTQNFKFLRGEMAHITSALGQRHLWLWLTKRPELMQKFAGSIGGMPANVCCMTTVTSEKTLSRVNLLRRVDASVRGLSIEPLWSSVADKLDLTGIDWVIVGGESGAKNCAEPFHLEWALELKALCEQQGVAFFCKQLGRRPIRNGSEISLSDPHGGDWDEWDEDLRVRQFPTYFHKYRRHELVAQ